jgi:hypothetical protein
VALLAGVKRPLGLGGGRIALVVPAGARHRARATRLALQVRRRWRRRTTSGRQIERGAHGRLRFSVRLGVEAGGGAARIRRSALLRQAQRALAACQHRTRLPRLAAASRFAGLFGSAELAGKFGELREPGKVVEGEELTAGRATA